MFAIRQISTGWFMPTFPKNTSKGSTWLEPKADCIPRLFRRKQDAVCVLDHWLKGQLTVVRDFFDEAVEDWKYKPVPSRSADDMEIVEVTILVKDF
jgi:hypothetical protein